MCATAQFVSKIVGPAGKVVWSNNAPGKRVLSPEVARTETQMLTGVLKSGTAAGLSINRPAAGKTGTTDDKADAWFVGYTPQFTTAVWMGDPLFPTPMTNVGGISVFGATYPADIWKAYMEAAHEKLPVVDFIQPNEDHVAVAGAHRRVRPQAGLVLPVVFVFVEHDSDDGRDRRAGVGAAYERTADSVAHDLTPAGHQAAGQEATQVCRPVT